MKPKNALSGSGINESGSDTLVLIAAGVLIYNFSCCLDLSMAALFELVSSEAGQSEGPGGDGHSEGLSEKAIQFTERMLQLFESHILPTHKIFHLQYLVFYLAGTGYDYLFAPSGRVLQALILLFVLALFCLVWFLSFQKLWLSFVN
jgi:hypothetical protein